MSEAAAVMRIAVTGLGAVTPVGTGKDEVWARA